MKILDLLIEINPGKIKNFFNKIYRKQKYKIKKISRRYASKKINLEDNFQECKLQRNLINQIRDYFKYYKSNGYYDIKITSNFAQITQRRR